MGTQTDSSSRSNGRASGMDVSSGGDPEDDGREEKAARPSSPLRLVEQVAGRRRRMLVAISISAFLGGFAEAAVLVIIARVAFSLASGDSSIKVDLGSLGEFTVPTAALIGVAAALTVVRVLLQVFQINRTTHAFARIWSDVRLRITRLYFGASWALQSQERDGKLQELLTTYASQVASSINALSGALVALVSLVAFLATAFFVNLIAAVVVMAAAIGVGMVLRPLRNLVRRRSRSAAEANLAFATDITEYAAHAQEVRVFGVGQEVLGRVRVRVDAASREAQRSQYAALLTPALYQGMALLLVVGAVAVVYAVGFTQLASLGAIVLIMVRSLSYGQQLQLNYQSMHAAAPYFEKLQAEEARYRLAALTEGGDPIEFIRRVEFRDVSYEYMPGRPVLRQLSFEIEPREIVGIIGPSGSGKSTLVQLLLRLREPTSGCIVADGRDVSTIAYSSWYERVSFVPQEPRFFAGSVAENIRFYRESVDDAAVVRAAKLANLHDEIMANPEGYDASVGERGSRLSGGQRQRLSIARALADEPNLIVLDEPTSSLDMRSEQLIRETMHDLAERTTVVVIAHRLSTLDVCDRIMVIADGMLQGFDAPAQLEATNPFYREALRLAGIR
jgi:ABC-type multidrug transport system fused ATPase/permease subunit